VGLTEVANYGGDVALFGIDQIVEVAHIGTSDFSA
jgi:hypothetical protein